MGPKVHFDIVHFSAQSSRGVAHPTAIQLHRGTLAVHIKLQIQHSIKNSELAWQRLHYSISSEKHHCANSEREGDHLQEMKSKIQGLFKILNVK